MGLKVFLMHGVGASDDALSLGQAAARAIAEQAGADFLREIGAEMKL